MAKLVFLLEEPSMEEVLTVVLPKILPPTTAFQLIPHTGKSDLEKSIPRKLAAWNEPDVRFVVIRDKDSGDCVIIKKNLAQICATAGRGDTLVRIVCHELESWLLGDLAAVEAAYNVKGLSAKQGKRKFRQPDLLANASDEIKNLIPNYQKIAGARTISPHLNIDKNHSHSFNVFINGVRGLV